MYWFSSLFQLFFFWMVHQSPLAHTDCGRLCWTRVIIFCEQTKTKQTNSTIEVLYYICDTGRMHVDHMMQAMKPFKSLFNVLFLGAGIISYAICTLTLVDCALFLYQPHQPDFQPSRSSSPKAGEIVPTFLQTWKERVKWNFWIVRNASNRVWTEHPLLQQFLSIWFWYASLSFNTPWWQQNR